MKSQEFNRLMAAVLLWHQAIMNAPSIGEAILRGSHRNIAIAELFKTVTGKDMQDSDLDSILFDFDEELEEEKDGA